MHIVQVVNDSNEVVAAIVNGDELELLAQPLYTIALHAANQERKLDAVLSEFRTDATLSYDKAISDGRLRAPITHPEPANLLLTGTGLTHLGSAAPRSQMHEGENVEAKTAQPTDTQRMFDLGVAGGKPAADEVGAQPEWFYKGTGHTLRAPFAEITMPDFWRIRNCAIAASVPRYSLANSPRKSREMCPCIGVANSFGIAPS